MLKALLEKRATAVQGLTALIERAEAENRDFTEDETAAYVALDDEIKQYDVRISRVRAISTLCATGIEAGAIVPPGFIAQRPAGDFADPKPKEFVNFGEFVHAIAYNRDDHRLASLYAEQRMDDGPRGGFAIPAQFMDVLMQVSPQEALFRSRARVLPAGNPPDAKMSFPALDQDTAAAPDSVFGGVKMSWVGEGATKPATEFKLRLIELEPFEIAGTLEATDKMLRNWAASSSLIQKLFTDARISAEDTAFLKGDGVAKPLGVLNAGATLGQTRAVANQVAYADLVGMVSKVLMQGGTPVWSISQSAMPQIMQIKDTLGNLIWQPNAREGVPQSLLGYPLFWNNRAPLLGTAGDVMLLNLGYYLIKDGSGPFFSASEHVKFVENKTVFKMFFNVDGQPWLKEPFSQENTFETSPFIRLNA